MDRDGHRKPKRLLGLGLIATCLALGGCAKKNKTTIDHTGRGPVTSQPVDEAPTPQIAGMQSHLVGPHESLYGLARKYYGDGRLWQKIYYANRNRISDPNRLPVGIRLIIPPKEGE